MKCTLGRLWCVSNKMSFKKGTQGKCNALTAIQFLSVHMAPLLNKPYVNGVTLREQNLSLKTSLVYETKVCL